MRGACQARGLRLRLHDRTCLRHGRLPAVCATANSGRQLERWSAPAGPRRVIRDSIRRARGRLAMSVGGLGTSVPLSTEFGFDRGTPIDRYYIEAFLAANAGDVRGRVLEIGDDSYSRQFGADRI